mmetsp:Transcript_14828/g.34944  ORF Transcript_14828/g.34944 Transcript_14828/m.34944 type:complete len:228 (+) Transcript_14828:131-814(+)
MGPFLLGLFFLFAKSFGFMITRLPVLGEYAAVGGRERSERHLVGGAVIRVPDEGPVPLLEPPLQRLEVGRVRRHFPKLRGQLRDGAFPEAQGEALVREPGARRPFKWPQHVVSNDDGHAAGGRKVHDPRREACARWVEAKSRLLKRGKVVWYHSVDDFGAGLFSCECVEDRPADALAVRGPAVVHVVLGQPAVQTEVPRVPRPGVDLSREEDERFPRARRAPRCCRF